MSAKNQKLNLSKELLYKLYIEDMMTSNEVADILGCSSKSVRNYLKQYNISIRQNAEAVSLERSKWSQEKENARAKAVTLAWNQKSPDEIAAANVKRAPYQNTPQAIEKARQTKMQNGTSKTSKAENQFYDQLCLWVDDPSQIKRGYTCSRYPYNCDFYLEDKDLFIEYQGHQTHGTEPFNQNNSKHRAYLELMTMQHIDMTTWTVRDPQKLQTALKNKITLLIIYPYNNSYLIKDGQIQNIGKFNIVDINDIN